MATSHFYITAHGEWSSTSAWNGERAQFGLRLSPQPTVGAPDMGTVFNMPTIDAATVKVDSVAGLNGTLTQQWEQATLLAPWTGEVFNAADQIDCAEDIRTFLNAVKAYTSAEFKWTHVKLAPIQPDGSYSQPSSIYTFTTPLAGSGTASSALPPECALAVSLRAPIIGRRGRGRIYLPALTNNMLSTGGVLGGTPGGTIKTAMKTLVDDLQNLPSGPRTWFPLVTVTSAGSALGVRPSAVRVGSHIDVQKRRQHQVPESYVEQAL